MLLDTTIDNAKAVLLCITASSRVDLDEIEKLSSAVRSDVHPEANIIFSLRTDDMMGDDLQAMIIATIFEKDTKQLKNPDKPHLGVCQDFLF